MLPAVTTFTDDQNVFRPLIIMLNDFLKPGAPYPIPEVVYEKEMFYRARVPNENFYLRAIISSLLRTHGNFRERVWSDPGLKIGFQCRYYEEGKLRVREFSNMMLFYEDVITMIYLYFFYKIQAYFPPQICELAMIMINKYLIHETREMKDRTKITFRRVTQSFQSVTLWMYNYMPQRIALVRNVFPSSTLPAMISSINFPLILPQQSCLIFTNKYLITLNMAITSLYEKSPIRSIYQHLIQCSTWNDVYTQDLRIYICTKLGILRNQHGAYAFASNLEVCFDYYVKAIQLILEITMQQIPNISVNDMEPLFSDLWFFWCSDSN